MRLEVIHLSGISPEMRDEMRRRAAADGLSLSAWMRRHLIVSLGLKTAAAVHEKDSPAPAESQDEE